jgi:hypothetical protein
MEAEREEAAVEHRAAVAALEAALAEEQAARAAADQACSEARHQAVDLAEELHAARAARGAGRAAAPAGLAEPDAAPLPSGAEVADAAGPTASTPPPTGARAPGAKQARRFLPRSSPAPVVHRSAPTPRVLPGRVAPPRPLSASGRSEARPQPSAAAASPPADPRSAARATALRLKLSPKAPAAQPRDAVEGAREATTPAVEQRLSRDSSTIGSAGEWLQRVSDDSNFLFPRAGASASPDTGTPATPASPAPGSGGVRVDAGAIQAREAVRQLEALHATLLAVTRERDSAVEECDELRGYISALDSGGADHAFAVA